MALIFSGYVDMPSHQKFGGFDHAAIHSRMGHLYVANTSNDSLDVIDCFSELYLKSLPDFSGVAGVLVSNESNLVFASNRGDNTVSIFSPENDADVTRVNVGTRPNGLAFDFKRGLLLVGHVGDRDIPGTAAIYFIDVYQREVVAKIPVGGSSRWAAYNEKTDLFYINITQPPQIAVISPSEPTKINRVFEVPVAGPHGLDVDLAGQRLFCACDSNSLVVLDAVTGTIQAQHPLSGGPDVVFFSPVQQRLYVAIGNPGAIDLFDTRTMRHIGTTQTETGAHTIAFDSTQSKVYAFLSQTHRVAVYRDDV